MSVEVPAAESVGTVAGAQSWRQRVLKFREMRQRSYERLMMCMAACEQNGEQVGNGGA